MTPEELAAIHAACFTQQRPWRAAEFQTLLADKANFLITRGAGFLLGRTVLDEAELMTIAVDPTARRAGLGAALVATFEAEAKARGAVTAYLEVSSDNVAGQALYAGAGWQNAGRRRNYYGDGVDALVLRKLI